MQLGTRWAFGATPPASVPGDVRARIAEVESTYTAGAGAGRHWTLTWLEGRPIAELDDGTVVRDGRVHAPGVADEASDDEW